MNCSIVARNILIIIALLAASCTAVDDTLGSEFIPDDQQLRTHIVTLGADPAQADWIACYQRFEDSLPANRQGWIAIGSDRFAPLGTTRASALVQLTPQSYDTAYHVIDYLPVIDSAFIRLYVLDNSSSTKHEPQQFTIWEVGDLGFMEDSTLFYNYPIASHTDLSTPLFTFALRSDTTGTLASKLDILPAGAAWLDRLVNTDITYPDIETYRAKDSLFVERFKGLVIAPTDPAAVSGIRRIGTSYNLYSTTSGLSIFLRNHKRDSVGVIADTVVAYYDFNDEPAAPSYGTAAGYPQSVIHLEREYNASLSINQPARPVTTAWVEGMGGLYTRLQLRDELFARLNELRGNRQLVLNSALLYLEVEGGDDPAVLDEAFTRLGMYERYALLSTPIPDYNRYYEQQGMVIPYGGKLNRAAGGYYTMDITTTLQRMLADPAYPRHIDVTPDNDLLTDYSHTPLRGSNIKLKLTYTLVP